MEYAEQCKTQIESDADGCPDMFAESLSKEWVDEIAQGVDRGLLEQTKADELMELIREKMQGILGIPECPTTSFSS